MSRTLNLVDHLLAKGSHLHQLGVHHEAIRRLRRLANLSDLPREAAEETQRRLADIYLQKGQLGKARRHLTAALNFQPDHAEYHFLLAGALIEGHKADPPRALEHFRKAIAFEPENANYQAAFGLQAIRQGKTDDGLSALRRAYELAGDAHDIVETVIEGLHEAGEVEEAWQKLRLSLFRNHRNRRFHSLWERFQFRLLQDVRAAQSAEMAEQRMLLPFFPAEPDASLRDKQVRRDKAARPAAPHFPRTRRLADRKLAK